MNTLLKFRRGFFIASQSKPQRLNKTRFLQVILTALFLISMVWFSYLGRYHTIYGAGFLLTPTILLLSLLPFLASAFIFFKSWSYSLRVYFVSASLMFSVLIASFYIENYKPSIYVNIPEQFQGRIILFNTESNSKRDIEISENGVGYLPYPVNYRLKFKYGDKKIQQIENTINTNQIQFYNADSTMVHWVDVSCYKVGSGVDYEADHFVPRDFKPCMDGSQLRQFIRLNKVDSSKIRWLFYHYPSQSYVQPQ